MELIDLLADIATADVLASAADPPPREVVSKEATPADVP